MDNDRIAASEIPPWVATGACLVRTPVTVAIREVTIPVSPDLFRLCVPVEAVSYPAEFRNITAEIGDRQNFDVVPVVIAGSTSVTVSLLVSAFVAVATAIRLRSRLRFDSSGRSGGGLVQMATRDIEGHKDGLMLLVILKGTGGCLGGERHLLVLRNDRVSNGARSYSRKNRPLSLLRRRPARSISGTIGSG